MEFWKNSIIYFILIDRFANGDQTNDDFGKGEFNPADDNCFQGGDLKGVIQRLPYIKKLGFNAIWITPPVYNQWINPGTDCRGYHGYWAYDFMQIDPHFGSLEDFKQLVAEAHRLGLRVIQDIVVNHAGNYFTVDATKYDPTDPRKGWKRLEGSFPPEGEPKAPRDPVFSLNDPNIEEHRRAAIYNFTPNIWEYNDRHQTLNYTVADLDDIDLRSPAAARRMREIYRYWIEETGIDGYRIDTVFYTPEEFYEGFVHSAEPANLGMKPLAAKKGLRDFFVFGEVWNYNFEALNKYIGENCKERLDSVIDFPLNEALVRVFYKKLPTRELVGALKAPRLNRELWVNFLDNHDIERMYSRADWPAIQQSMVALFTLPGIPCVYYGTERGYKELRRNMFSDKPEPGTTKYAAFLKKCTKLRNKHPVFNNGKLRIERTSCRSGLLAYETRGRNETILTVFNTSLNRSFYDFAKSDRQYEPLFASDPVPGKRLSGSVILEPGAYLVLRELEEGLLSRPAKAATTKPPRLRLPSSRRLKGPVRLAFDAGKGRRPLYLVADGNFDKKLALPRSATRSFELDTSLLGNGEHSLRLIAKEGKGWLASEEIAVRVNNPYVLLADTAVGPEQCRGVHGNVEGPGDASYRGQLDIRRVRCLSSGKDLRLELEMGAVTNDWKAPNGFDHVYFHVFFDLPERRGKSILPKLGHVPKGFNFDFGFLFYGWGSVSFDARTTTIDEYGRPIVGEFFHKADVSKNKLIFDFAETCFGDRRNFSGVKIFIATWDGYLGKLHGLSARKEDWAFHVTDGMPPAQVPRILSQALLEI